MKSYGDAFTCAIEHERCVSRSRAAPVYREGFRTRVILRNSECVVGIAADARAAREGNLNLNEGAAEIQARIWVRPC